MKEIEWKLLSELMKNSRRSDRQLARKIGSSQPTVTRIRNRLEKQGYIREYTFIPDFTKIGFEIMAFTFLKWTKNITAEDFSKVIQAGREKDKQKPMSVILVVRGMGTDCDAIIVSLHENFAAFRKLIDTIRQFPFSDSITIKTFTIDLTDVNGYSPLTFSSLAAYLPNLRERMVEPKKRK